VVAAPSADDLRLADLFLRCLDADGDGILTTDELRRAPRSLGKYDSNDDEYIELAELLAGAGAACRPARARLHLGTAAAGEALVLRLDLGPRPGAKLEGKRDDTVKLVTAPAGEGPYRLHAAAGWALTFRTVRSTADVRSAGEFLLAQFKTALGDAAALTKNDLQDDAALAGFLELLPYADRNGDGRLTLAELQAYLDLVERGVGAQVWVTATDRDRNPFGFLDRDGDGRLSYREQVAAPDLLGGKAAIKGLPMQFDLSFGGPPVKAWGGVAIPAVKRPVVRQASRGAVPAWFRAMDRNGDGVISPREFIGPPELFRKLDADGDGVISPAEAARATRRSVGR
jgi:Ca2+-binding EF-hand superfamily protein